MKFDDEDQYIIQALTAHLQEKYDGAYVVAATREQTMLVNNSFLNDAVVDNLLGVIEKLQGNDEKENEQLELSESSQKNLLNSVEAFLEDAFDDLKHLRIDNLKDHLEILKSVVEDTKKKVNKDYLVVKG